VIFRRGPSKSVQLILWNIETDSFISGQWFKGRIYERRCDLSPDGSKLIYFAAKRSTSTIDSTIGETWTAISKPPYLTALALWPKGDSWNGGGLFDSSGSIFLNHPDFSLDAHAKFKPPANFRVANEQFQYGEDDPILWRRLTRDGWKLIKPWSGAVAKDETLLAKFDQNHDIVRPSEKEWLRELILRGKRKRNGYVTFGANIAEKQSESANYSLIWKNAIIEFESFAEFSVRDNKSGQRHHLENASWADWDNSGRLVFVAEGKVYSGSIESGALTKTLLADFNANKFCELQAPIWAQHW
jgi:hypothetical protein